MFKNAGLASNRPPPSYIEVATGIVRQWSSVVRAMFPEHFTAQSSPGGSRSVFVWVNFLHQHI
jgi:hypothetical protein